MSWDKDKPAGTQKLRLSDDEIRDNWAALEDALGRDHEFPGTEGNTAGKHNGVRFRQQSAAPSTAATELALYVKEVSGVPEMFLRRQDNGSEKQLSFNGGGIGIPPGTRMAFYQAAAPGGWSLVTGLTNGTLMYIDHANGGTQKSGGTWTIGGLNGASHSHGAGSYKAGSHNHCWSYYSSQRTYSYNSGGSSVAVGAYHGEGNDWGIRVNGDNNYYLNGTYYTNNANPSVTGTSSSATVPISSDGSWRPPGYNFIIAEKN